MNTLVSGARGKRHIASSASCTSGPLLPLRSTLTTNGRACEPPILPSAAIASRAGAPLPALSAPRAAATFADESPSSPRANAAYVRTLSAGSASPRSRRFVAARLPMRPAASMVRVRMSCDCELASRSNAAASKVRVSSCCISSVSAATSAAVTGSGGAGGRTVVLAHAPAISAATAMLPGSLYILEPVEEILRQLARRRIAVERDEFRGGGGEEKSGRRLIPIDTVAKRQDARLCALEPGFDGDEIIVAR